MKFINTCITEDERCNECNSKDLTRISEYEFICNRFNKDMVKVGAETIRSKELDRLKEEYNNKPINGIYDVDIIYTDKFEGYRYRNIKLDNVVLNIEELKKKGIHLLYIIKDSEIIWRFDSTIWKNGFTESYNIYHKRNGMGSVFIG